MPDPKKSEKPVVEIKGIHKTIGSKSILENIDIEIKQGEVYGIVGASGSGRTVLLELIIGFENTDIGTIHITPYEELNKKSPKKIMVSKESIDVKRIVGFSSQKPSFYENLTVEDNFNYYGRLYDMDPEFLEKRIRHLCGVFTLDKFRMSEAGQLPLTAQRRFDIALALLHDPEILILDEPAADLDAVYREYIYKIINKINALGTTVIIGTHFLNELDILCHRIGILYDRKIITQGPVKAVIKQYGNEKKIKIVTETAVYQPLVDKLDKEKLNIVSITKNNEELIIETTESHKTLKEIMKYVEQQNEEIVSLTIEEPSLSEVFFKLANKKEEKNG